MAFQQGRTEGSTAPPHPASPGKSPGESCFTLPHNCQVSGNQKSLGVSWRACLNQDTGSGGVVLFPSGQGLDAHGGKWMPAAGTCPGTLVFHGLGGTIFIQGNGDSRDECWEKGELPWSSGLYSKRSPASVGLLSILSFWWRWSPLWTLILFQ